MSQQEENSQDEIDLSQLFSVLKKTAKRAVVLCIGLANSFLKRWKVILFLIIIGSVSGYFLEKKRAKTQESKILLRINFEGVNIIYNAVELLGKKAKENDTLFFKSLGLSTSEKMILKISIEPIINFKELLEKYEPNKTNLATFFRNLDFERDFFLDSETFSTEYRHHVLNLKLSEKASSETISKVIAYLNSNTLLSQRKERNKKSLKDQIANNQEVVKQIDDVIKSYRFLETSRSKSTNFYIDKDLNINQLIQTKVNLQNKNEALKEELLLSKEVVIAINQHYLTKSKASFTENYKVVFPILLVGGLIIFVFFRSIDVLK